MTLECTTISSGRFLISCSIFRVSSVLPTLPSSSGHHPVQMSTMSFLFLFDPGLPLFFLLCQHLLTANQSFIYRGLDAHVEVSTIFWGRAISPFSIKEIKWRPTHIYKTWFFIITLFVCPKKTHCHFPTSLGCVSYVYGQCHSIALQRNIRYSSCIDRIRVVIMIFFI